MSKITFTNLPPAQGCASPSSKLVLLQIDHNYTVGVIYVYIRIDCQSSILSHMVPELYNQYFNLLELQRLHRKIHRSRTVQIHHSLVAGSVPRSWLNFFERTKKNGGKTTRKNWASYMPLSQLGVPSSSRPIHIMYSFFGFHIRLPAQRGVAGSIFWSLFSVFFHSKKLSQPSSWSDVFELARCCWGSSFHLREPADFSQCVQLPGSVPNDSFNWDGTPVAAQKFRSHVLGQICLDSGTTLKSNTWPLLKLNQLHVLS